MQNEVAFFTLHVIWLKIPKYSIKELLEQQSTSAVSNKSYGIGCWLLLQAQQ